MGKKKRVTGKCEWQSTKLKKDRRKQKGKNYYTKAGSMRC